MKGKKSDSSDLFVVIIILSNHVFPSSCIKVKTTKDAHLLEPQKREQLKLLELYKWVHGDRHFFFSALICKVFQQLADNKKVSALSGAVSVKLSRGLMGAVKYLWNRLQLRAVLNDLIHFSYSLSFHT